MQPNLIPVKPGEIVKTPQLKIQRAQWNPVNPTETGNNLMSRREDERNALWKWNYWMNEMDGAIVPRNGRRG